MDETDSDLPASVELLWGLRDRSRRGGPKPTLSLDRIVSAAIELADAGGLAAVSMSRLADKLGFTTMSLYRYIASKEELLLLMVDASIGPLPQIDVSGGWRERAEAWSRELLVFTGHTRGSWRCRSAGCRPGRGSCCGSTAGWRHWRTPG